MSKGVRRIYIGGVEFCPPLFLASGTVGYGYEISRLMDLRKVGAVVTKGISKKRRDGNPPPRVAEFVVSGVAVGLVNSIGLQNPGAEAFTTILAELKRVIPTKIVVNVFGEREEEYGEVIGILEESASPPDAYELNLSCPNVERGGLEFGVNPESVSKVLRYARRRTKSPIFAKLSPFSGILSDIVRASLDEGCDALVLTNTIPAAVRDVRGGFLRGGLSGYVLKPIALRCVLDVKERFPDIKVIACGGIYSAEDVRDFFDAGACAVQIGTANFLNPRVAEKIYDEVMSVMV